MRTRGSSLVILSFLYWAVRRLLELLVLCARVKKSHSIIPAACRRRNSDQLTLARLGAEPIPCRRRMFQTLLGASDMPRPRRACHSLRHKPVHDRGGAPFHLAGHGSRAFSTIPPSRGSRNRNGSRLSASGLRTTRKARLLSLMPRQRSTRGSARPARRGDRRWRTAGSRAPRVARPERQARASDAGARRCNARRTRGEPARDARCRTPRHDRGIRFGRCAPLRLQTIELGTVKNFAGPNLTQI